MSTSQDYPLTRNYRSSSRLNTQHLIWTRLNGYLIHPAIPIKPDAVIGEVGVGTGCWLFDVASELPPTTKLKGFDVDLSQCPHPKWVPPNVELGKLDVHEPTPADLHDCFDLVHIRFFICVIRNADPSSVLDGLKSMVKKGGYIQWTEQDPHTLRLVKADDSIQAPHTEKLVSLLAPRLQGLAGSSPGWIASLGDTFRKHGLLDVQVDHRAKRDDDLVSFHDTVLLAMEEMSHYLPNGDDGSELRALIDAAAQELEESGRGLAITGESFTVIGRVDG